MQDLSKKQIEGLESLIIAALISTGEIDRCNNEEWTLRVPFSIEKSYYLLNFLKQHSLNDYVIVETKREQIKLISPLLVHYYNQWYKEGDKIFSKKADPSLLSFNSIITSVNLFGERRLEGLSIQTSVCTAFVKNLTYCLEKSLETTVLPSRGLIKIPNVNALFVKFYNELSLLDSTEMSNYLTNQEKKNILKEKKGAIS